MKSRRKYLARALIWVAVTLCLCLLCGLPALIVYTDLTDTAFIVGLGYFDFAIAPKNLPSSPRIVQVGQPNISTASFPTFRPPCDQTHVHNLELGEVRVALQTCDRWANPPPSLPTRSMMAIPPPPFVPTVAIPVYVPTMVPTVHAEWDDVQEP